MTREEIINRISTIVKNNLPDFEEREIDETTQINTEANFDSMTFVYVMCKIEAEFGIQIPKRKWERMKTMADIADAVEKELNRK